MKHFQQIAAGIDVIPILNALKRQPELWDQNTIRTKHPGTAHADVSDIILRFNDIEEYAKTGDPRSIVNDEECKPYPAWYALPQVRPVILDLMRRVEGARLGRCVITKLPPGKCVTPHVDGGAPATYYERYQIALQSLPGALFKIGDEVAQFQTGDVWWIDNATIHSVTNNSADERIVLIVDIRGLE